MVKKWHRDSIQGAVTVPNWTIITTLLFVAKLSKQNFLVLSCPNLMWQLLYYYIFQRPCEALSRDWTQPQKQHTCAQAVICVHPGMSPQTILFNTGKTASTLFYYISVLGTVKLCNILFPDVQSKSQKCWEKFIVSKKNDAILRCRNACNETSSYLRNIEKFASKQRKVHNEV